MTSRETDNARNGAGNRIVFVDPGVGDLHKLLADIAPGADIVALDRHRGTLEQVAETLNGHRGISSVHVIAPAKTGQSDLSTHGFRLSSDHGVDVWSASGNATDALAQHESIALPAASMASAPGHASGEAHPDGVSLSLIYSAVGPHPSGNYYDDNELGFSYGTFGDSQFDNLFTGYSGPAGFLGTPYNSSTATDFTQLGNKVLFVATNAAHGRELWSTDGTVAGTSELININAGGDAFPGVASHVARVVVGSEMYFAANDGSHGTELWKTDGTAGGTQMVADVNSGAGSGVPQEIVNFGGQVAFSGADGTMALGSLVLELFVSDGTAAGTHKIFTPTAGAGAFTPASVGSLAVSGGHIFFQVYDGTFNSNSTHLYVSDGTAGGTHDLLPDITELSIQKMYDVGGTLYFSMNDGVHNNQLWISDGTTAGTTMVTNVSGGLTAQFFTPAGGGITYFVGTDTVHSGQLWRTDGTQAGTQMVANIVNESGVTNAIFTSLVVIGDKVYFGAQTTLVGSVQLWESDGTEAGTHLVDGGGGAIHVTGLQNVNGTLYFLANGTDNHLDIFKYDGTHIVEVANNVSGISSADSDNAGSGFGNFSFLPVGSSVEGKPDAFTTGEGTAIAGQNLFSDHGSGADTGSPLSIAQVNGSAGNVGTLITLASGAHLTVNANGTFTYDPNHAFDWLPAAGSGAATTTATETFTYQLDGAASPTTVTITITGVDSDDIVTGTTGNDMLAPGTGNDTVQGLAGDDTINMGSALTASDKIDGGADNDTVNLNGDYTLVMTATTMVNVEKIVIAAGHSYALTTVNATVASGQTLTVDATALGAGSALTFNGAAESDGLFVLKGGAGADSFLMGSHFTAGDTIDGGAGTDVLSLGGDYSGGLTFGAATITNVETISFAAGSSYKLTMNDANVAAGQTLTVQAGTLGAADALAFDGTAEATAGSFVINSGAGNDTLKGGNGADTFRSGTGNDTILGGDGDDTINMGAALTASDHVDGGAGNDTLFLAGDYSAGVTFAATTLTGVETIILSSGFDYSLTLDDANFGAGQALTVKASTLGASDDFVFNGAAESSAAITILAGAGTDSLTGGGGDDSFKMGASFTAADHVDGGAGNDTLFLTGDYTAGVTLGAATLSNVETIALAAGFDYTLVLNNANIAAGQTLTLRANTLAAGDNINFDASTVTGGGTVVINAGAGNDKLNGTSGADIIHGGDGTNKIAGGGGADTLSGGTGVDKFYYLAVSDSTSTAYDKITGFDASMDGFKFTGFSVTGVDSAVVGGKLSTASFDTNLAAAIDGFDLGAHHAVLFTADTGSLHGHTFLVVDVNGVAGYQAGQDLVIDVTGAANLGSLSLANFT